MATYSFEGPDGKTYHFDGPDTPSTPKRQSPRGGLLEQSPQESPQSMLGMAYDALNAPAQKAKEGLQGLSNLIPAGTESGNLAKDVVTGLPRLAGDTLAEFAPSFIDAPSILTGGASKVAGPVLKGAGKALSQFGKLSGATAEGLQEVARNPKSLFSSVKKAGELFSSAKEATPFASSAKTPKAFINRAEALAKKGLLTASEALEARKEVDKLYKASGMTEARKHALRPLFDQLVKADPLLKEADVAYKTAAVTEPVRNLLPVNQGGTTSALKSTLLGLMGGGSFLNPAIGAVAAPLLSPAVQGGLAALLGPTGRLLSSPGATVSTGALLRKLLEDRKGE